MHRCRKCLVEYVTAEEVSGSDSTQAMMGSIIHGGFIPYFEKKEGVRVVYREKEIACDYFTGHIDGYIKKTKQLFELKTVSTWEFNKITEPKIEHLQQALCYRYMDGFESVKFVYLNRDTGEYKCFDVDLTTTENTAIMNALINKAKWVYEHVENGLGIDDVEFDPFEMCDGYCEHGSKSADTAPEKDSDAKEIDEIENSDALKQFVRDYNEAKEAEDEAKKRKELAGNLIKETLEKSGTKEILGYAVYYKNEKKAFDKDALKKEYPDVYAKFEKTTASTYFRVKG
ncbi:MAG: hypothetical protein EOL93_00565 [Epsilonproteobacteria bacterium]|nr:hypothetical protein [Campylobacterota bacterium]